MKKKYSVLVEGKNIYLNRGHIERMGFFTTRWVEAISKDEAKTIAVNLIKQELEALDVVCNPPEDSPVFLIEKVREVESLDDFIVPGKGFTFFHDKEAGSH